MNIRKYEIPAQIFNLYDKIRIKIERNINQKRYEFKFCPPINEKLLSYVEKEFQKIGIKLYVINLEPNYNNNKIIMTIELIPLDIFQKIIVNPEIRYNFQSDFFPPYFNVFYVFHYFNDEIIEILRKKVYLTLETKNFPKKIKKEEVLELSDYLMFNNTHFKQIASELHFRGIVFEFYNN